MFKFIQLILCMLFVFGTMVMVSQVNADTMYAVIPSSPKPGGTSRWAWLWGKHMNNNLSGNIEQIDFKYIPGNRGKNALRKFESKLKYGNYMMTSHGGNAMATLLEDVGNYDFRKYKPILIHPGNMLIPKRIDYNPKFHKQKFALNPGGGSEPDHFAAGLMVCPETNDMDKFMKCFKDRVIIVKGMKSGGARIVAFVNGELNVSRDTFQNYTGNAKYKKALSNNELEIWFHHCQMNYKTGQWVDDPNPELKGLCFDYIFEQTHGFKPKGEVYDAYVLLRLWRDGIQKSFFVTTDSVYYHDMVTIATKTWFDEEFQKERLKKLGNYGVFIGQDSEFIIKRMYEAVNESTLKNAVRSVNEGLGYKAVVKHIHSP